MLEMNLTSSCLSMRHLSSTPYVTSTWKTLGLRIFGAGKTYFKNFVQFLSLRVETGIYL
jgi:hypothetical protein